MARQRPELGTIETLSKSVRLDPYVFGRLDPRHATNVDQVHGIPILLGKPADAVAKMGDSLGIGVARLAIDLCELLLESLREETLQAPLVPTAGSELHEHLVSGDSSQPEGAKGRSVSKSGSFCRAATIVC